MANVTFRPSSIASFPGHFLTEWKELINEKVGYFGALNLVLYVLRVPDHMERKVD